MARASGIHIIAANKIQVLIGNKKYNKANFKDKFHVIC